MQLIKRALFLVLAVFSTYAGATDWAQDKKQVKTIQKASLAVLRLAQLERLSTICHNNDYYSVEYEQALATLVKQKLLINIDNFRVILTEEQELEEHLSSSLKGITCSDFDVDELLDSAYQQFDNALFALDVAYGLDKPFTSNVTYENDSITQLRKQIKTLIKDSKIIAMGTVLDYDKTPRSFRSGGMSKDSLTFKTEKGWKGRLEAYFPVTDLSSKYKFANPYLDKEQAAEEELKRKKRSITHYKNQKVIIFIDKTGWSISSWLPVESDDFNYYAEQLGEHDWQFVGFAVADNPKKAEDNF